MSHNKSAIKRIRQSEVRKTRNRVVRKRLATLIKSVRNAQNKAEGEKQLKLAVSHLDQAAAKGLIHRNKAANQKSRLTRLVATL